MKISIALLLLASIPRGASLKVASIQEQPGAAVGISINPRDAPENNWSLHPRDAPEQSDRDDEQDGPIRRSQEPDWIAAGLTETTIDGGPEYTFTHDDIIDKSELLGVTDTDDGKFADFTDQSTFMGRMTAVYQQRDVAVNGKEGRNIDTCLAEVFGEGNEYLHICPEGMNVPEIISTACTCFILHGGTEDSNLLATTGLSETVMKTDAYITKETCQAKLGAPVSTELDEFLSAVGVADYIAGAPRGAGEDFTESIQKIQDEIAGVECPFGGHWGGQNTSQYFTAGARCDTSTVILGMFLQMDGIQRQDFGNFPCSNGGNCVLAAGKYNSETCVPPSDSRCYLVCDSRPWDVQPYCLGNEKWGSLVLDEVIGAGQADTLILSANPGNWAGISLMLLNFYDKVITSETLCGSMRGTYPKLAWCSDSTRTVQKIQDFSTYHSRDGYGMGGADMEELADTLGTGRYANRGKSSLSDLPSSLSSWEDPEGPRRESPVQAVLACESDLCPRLEVGGKCGGEDMCACTKVNNKFWAQFEAGYEGARREQEPRERTLNPIVQKKVDAGLANALAEVAEECRKTMVDGTPACMSVCGMCKARGALLATLPLGAACANGRTAIDSPACIVVNELVSGAKSSQIPPAVSSTVSLGFNMVENVLPAVAPKILGSLGTSAKVRKFKSSPVMKTVRVFGR